jgi:hypothetical protein
MYVGVAVCAGATIHPEAECGPVQGAIAVTGAVALLSEAAAVSYAELRLKLSLRAQR